MQLFRLEYFLCAIIEIRSQINYSLNDKLNTQNSTTKYKFNVFTNECLQHMFMYKINNLACISPLRIKHAVIQLQGIKLQLIT